MQSLLVKGDRGMLRIELVDAPSQEGLLEAVPDIPIETGPLRRNGKLGIQHTSNFKTVKWGRQVFSFTKTQALAVEALVVAASEGVEWLDEGTLLGAAQSECDKIYPLFKGHPCWGTWIVSASQFSGRAATWMLSLAI